VKTFLMFTVVALLYLTPYLVLGYLIGTLVNASVSDIFPR
jgi:hypothetical protein